MDLPSYVHYLLSQPVSTGMYIKRGEGSREPSPHRFPGQAPPSPATPGHANPSHDCLTPPRRATPRLVCLTMPCLALPSLTIPSLPRLVCLTMPCHGSPSLTIPSLPRLALSGPAMPCPATPRRATSALPCHSDPCQEFAALMATERGISYPIKRLLILLPQVFGVLRSPNRSLLPVRILRRSSAPFSCRRSPCLSPMRG